MKNAVVAALCRRRTAAQARNWGQKPIPRACIRPSSGALSACVRGTPNLAGPMIATVSSIAAALAPKPSRAPRRSAARARATPPASAIQKPPLGAARAARNETTATCAGPAASGGATAIARGAVDMRATVAGAARAAPCQASALGVGLGLPGRVASGRVVLVARVAPDRRLGDAAAEIGNLIVTHLLGREAGLLQLVADSLHALDVIQPRAQLHHHRLGVLVVDGGTSVR